MGCCSSESKPQSSQGSWSQEHTGLSLCPRGSASISGLVNAAFGPDQISSNCFKCRNSHYCTPTEKHHEKSSLMQSGFRGELAWQSRLSIRIQYSLRSLTSSGDPALSGKLRSWCKFSGARPSRLCTLGRMSGFSTLFIDTSSESGGRRQSRRRLCPSCTRNTPICSALPYSVMSISIAPPERIQRELIRRSGRRGAAIPACFHRRWSTLTASPCTSSKIRSSTPCSTSDRACSIGT